MADNDSSNPPDVLLKNGLAVLVNSVKASNELPSSGTNYAFYNSFPAFQTLMSAQSSKILSVMQKCINHQGAKGSVLESLKRRELNDRFESLVEINDQLLEKIGSELDEAAGIRPPAADLVISSATTDSKRGGRFGRFSIKPPGPTSTPGDNGVGDNSTSTSSSRVRLLAGRNVARPQLHFAEPPDNSASPFQPRLRTKPNALRSLAESLIVNAESEDGDAPSFPHPYQYELEQFEASDELMKPHDIDKRSRPMEETPLTFVRTKHALEELIKLLRQEKEIAVDLEAHSYRTYLGMTCLMQLSTWKNDFIVDTLALWDDLQPLNKIFTDPKIVKVFHDATSDILWLQRDFGLYVVNLYDTSIAARLLGDRRLGLAHLLRNHCNVTAKKEFQLADWRVRPLPDPMVQYARTDTHYLLEICNRQRHLFINRGRGDQIAVVWRQGRERCLSRYEKPQLNENSYVNVYYNVKKDFNAQQIFVLRNLYSWRDQVARLEDESPAYVLPNHMLIMIADTLPREHTGVFACCNPIPSLVRKYIHDIHKLIMEAREIDVSKEKTLQKFKITPQLETDGPELPHDMSHTESHEPVSPVDNAAEAKIVANLSKSASPVVRFRRPGGWGNGGGSKNLHDPLSQYRISSSISISGGPKIEPNEDCLTNCAGRNHSEVPPPPPPVPATEPPPSPPPPPPPPQQPQTPAETESFRLQNAGKKKKRKRKAAEIVSREASDSPSIPLPSPPPPPPATDFQPFDYSKAKLPRSNFPTSGDRMMNMKTDFEGGSSQGKKPKGNTNVKKKLRKGGGRKTKK